MSAQKLEYPPKLSHCHTCRGKRTILTNGLKGDPRRFVKCPECKGIGHLTTHPQAVSEVTQAYAMKTPEHVVNFVPRETEQKVVHEVAKVEINPPKRRGRPPKTF